MFQYEAPEGHTVNSVLDDTEVTAGMKLEFAPFRGANYFGARVAQGRGVERCEARSIVGQSALRVLFDGGVSSWF
jgi:hypothetical protein